MAKRPRELPGAVRLAPDGADETLPIIQRSQTVIVYCTSAYEASSVAAAEHLWAHGCQNLYVLYGGLPAWQLAQGPIEPVRAVRAMAAPRAAAPRPALSRR